MGLAEQLCRRKNVITTTNKCSNKKFREERALLPVCICVVSVVRANDRADLFALDGADDILGILEREDKDGNVVVH